MLDGSGLNTGTAVLKQRSDAVFEYADLHGQAS